jgi:hypothetical protein
MSISLAYLRALKAFLATAYSATPPAHGTFGTMKIGVFQSDPEQSPAVLTLHTHNPYDESYSDPHWEFIPNQRGAGFGERAGYEAFGGQRELGGGGLYYMYWWGKLDYFMPRLGAEQETAWEDNDTLVSWLIRQIGLAQPHVLGVGTVDESSLVQTVVVSATTRERGGGPTSYIWTTLIKIQGLFYRST